MPEWIAAAAVCAGSRWWAGPSSCTCVFEATRVQPKLLELLSRQLDRCGPANLTVPRCGDCPPLQADRSLLLLPACGVALTLLWTLLPVCCELLPARAAAGALPAPALPAPPIESTPPADGRGLSQRSVTDLSDAGLGRTMPAMFCGLLRGRYPLSPSPGADQGRWPQLDLVRR
jgi:hypothetical protein